MSKFFIEERKALMTSPQKDIICGAIYSKVQSNLNKKFPTDIANKRESLTNIYEAIEGIELLISYNYTQVIKHKDFTNQLIDQIYNIEFNFNKKSTKLNSLEKYSPIEMLELYKSAYHAISGGTIFSSFFYKADPQLAIKIENFRYKAIEYNAINLAHERLNKIASLQAKQDLGFFDRITRFVQVVWLNFITRSLNTSIDFIDVNKMPQYAPLLLTHLTVLTQKHQALANKYPELGLKACKKPKLSMCLKINNGDTNNPVSITDLRDELPGGRLYKSPLNDNSECATIGVDKVTSISMSTDESIENIGLKCGKTG